MMFRWNYLIFKDLCKFFKLWLLIYGAKNEPFKASFRKNPKNHEFGKIPQKTLFCWFSGFSPFYPKIPLFLTPLKYPLFLTPLKNPIFEINPYFLKNSKIPFFQKHDFLKIGETRNFKFFHFLKKWYFCRFCWFCRFFLFSKKMKKCGIFVFFYIFINLHFL